jgi:nucleoside-diphosphate-sugar epimerase
MRNYGVEVRVARFHNIFGPEGTWTGGREKAPAALCRKVAETPNGGEIEIWGDGLQTRSFLYIDECVEGVRRLMDSDFTGPVNIGSEEMVTINRLAELIMQIAGKRLTIRHIPGPLGVRGRNSDNRLIQQKLGWQPSRPLRKGLEKTYAWVEQQVRQAAVATQDSLRELSRNLSGTTEPVADGQPQATDSIEGRSVPVPLSRNLGKTSAPVRETVLKTR